MNWSMSRRGNIYENWQPKRRQNKRTRLDTLFPKNLQAHLNRKTIIGEVGCGETDTETVLVISHAQALNDKAFIAAYHRRN